MRTFTQTLKFFFLTCALTLASTPAWAYSSTKLTVNISGSGQIKLNTSSSEPYSWSSSSLSAKQGPHGFWDVWVDDTYYIWVKPNNGYRCTGVSEATWNSAGYYTITFSGSTGTTEKTITATFVGNSYTLAFNGNENTGGSMTSQTFVYGTAQNIKANGFKREYTVTYNPNGGSCKANETAAYTLAGWAKSADGAVVYTPGQSLSTPTPIPAHNAIINLYAKWNATSVTLPLPTRDGYSFDGWYNGTTYVGKNGDDYTPTAAITLTAHWTPIVCTIDLDDQSATTPGTATITVTFDDHNYSSNPITIPTKTNCTFEGYCTEEGGHGTQIIDKNGNIIANKSSYTDNSSNWKYANSLTLHAYWKQNQTINWTLADGVGVEYSTGQEMGAVAISDYSSTPSGLAITYTTYPTSVATIVDGKLNVLIANAEVTVYANQGGDHNYNAASEKSKTFTTTGCTPDGHSVIAGDIKYGETLALSELDGVVTAGGVEVEGTLSWVEPATAPDAGENQPFAVLFTPTNSAVYSSYTFNVPVTVKKANPVITWNISSALRENTIYSHFVTSSNTENNTLTVTETSEYISISGLDLTTADEIGDTETASIRLTAHQNASANYNEITVYKDIIIYPKVAQCLPVSVNSADILSDMGSRFDGSGGWCNTSVRGEDSYLLGLFDVKYTQYVGIRLGNWNEGFSGINSLLDFVEMVKNWNLYPSTKSIELAFTGVPDSLTISTAMQTVSYNVAGWHDAPNGNPTPTWTLYQKSLDGTYSSLTTFTGNITDHKVPLDSTTRYVKITLHSAFAGFVTKLEISQKKYIRANESELEFGTNAKPLQEPQKLKIYYSSVGTCAFPNDTIVVTTDDPAFYVDKDTITSNVGIDQMGKDSVYVRCNDVNKTTADYYHVIFRSLHSNAEWSVPVRSTNPAITSTQTKIFQTGTEHAPMSGTAYRAQRTLFTSNILEGLFNGSPVFDTLYIYGVSESSAADRKWSYDASKGYKVPAISASNVHTPCFVYKKDGAQYTYVRTFDAATTTLDVADTKTRVLVGYRPEGPATTALQLGTGAVVNLNNTEIVSTGVAIHVSGDTATIAARGKNTVTSASNAAVQLSGATSLGIEDNWKSGEASAVLALRPAAGYPSIDLGSASGRVYINGTQLELHNAEHMAIAHMNGGEEQFDGEVHITDGSIGGEDVLGMPKLTFIDGGTFNDGRVDAYTLKGIAKRPRNSRGEIVSRHTMAPAALAAGYSWYGQDHLTPDGSAKVNPMLMDEEIWIFNGTNSDHSDDATSWNKESVPGETADVLINAPMVISGGELKVKSLTINWEEGEKGIPAVTIKPDGGLTVGEGGIDGIKVNMVNNLALKAGAEGATKGQTGFLRIHPNSAEPMPEATVELYSIGYYDYNDKAENIAKWQYVGSPLASSDVLAKTVYKKSWVYAWDEAANEWSNKRSTYTLTPFAGFATTQRTYADGMMLTYTGQIVSSETNVNIPLSYSGKGHGENVLANSFVAPIDITKFEDEDFKNIDSTVYLFNTGSRTDEEAAKETKDINTPGQYLAIPIGTARLLKGTFGLPTVIAPMQGFCVHAIKEDAEIKLNYEKLVWNGNYVENANTPLRVKAYYSEEDSENVGALRISLKANGWMDHLFMIESEQFNTKYEGGYDARKRMGDELNIFAVENNDQLSVDATNSIIGTRVGVRTGEETMYTMFFSHLTSEKELALLDWETEQITEITENAEYTFFAEPNSMITDRFEIIEWDGSNKPGIATGVENVENGTKVHKFIKDNQLFILKNGVLYNATGVLVR